MPNGTYVDYSDILVWVWIKDADEPCIDTWSRSYTRHQLPHEFPYHGLLPQGSEFIVVGSFLIKKMELWPGKSIYSVKSIFSITKSEKVTCTFVKGTFDNEWVTEPKGVIS